MRKARRTSQPSRLARALLAALTVASRAHAQQEPIDLTYRVAEGCPSERQFVAMVVGRAAKALILSERARGRKFHVTVTQQRKETLGRLEIVTSAASASREVTGANCGEVASALALFTALAIDPSAKTEPAAEPRADEAPTASEPKPEPKTATIAEAPSTASTSSIEPDARRAPPRETRPRGAEVLLGARALGLGAFASGSATPALARGVGPFVHWTTAGFGSYRAGASYFAATDTERATFQFFGGRVDGCPVGVHLARSLVLEPCLALEVGRVSATSKSAPALAPSTEQRWWVAGDLLARARFAPIPWIFAEVEAGVSVPFTRYTFLLGTENAVQDEVHEVPALGWVLGFGLGARIL
jgi:hypothetical protein